MKKFFGAVMLIFGLAIIWPAFSMEGSGHFLILLGVVPAYFGLVSLLQSPHNQPMITGPTQEHWDASDRVDEMAVCDGLRVTIFKRDGDWNYCIDEILDDEDPAEGMEEVPQFGDGYPSKDAARAAALAELA